MAHLNQQLFCQRVKAMFPDHFKNRKVLDIGGADINGTVRYLFRNCNYLSLDIWPGSGVDMVGTVDDLSPHFFSFDTVYCLEVAEHDYNYARTIMKGIELLKPGGLFLFTCASTGRPEHGTNRTKPQDSPATTDYYRNLTRSDLGSIPGFMENWKFWYAEERETDLRFFGIKKGGAGLKFKPSLIRYIGSYLSYWFTRRKKDIETVIRKGPTSSQIYKALKDSYDKKNQQPK